MNLFKIVITGLFFAILLTACPETPAPENTANADGNKADNVFTVPEKSPDELVIGESSYKSYCARCHKDDGTGGKVEIEGKMLNPEDLTAEKIKKEPDSEYIEHMTDGIPDEGMPSFKDELSEHQMKLVVKYIREKLQN